MTIKHHLIFVPGLSGTNFLFETTVKLWQLFGFETHVFPIVWKDGNDFKLKLNELLKLIDRLSTKNNKVSLIGTSAGGSMVLNAFLERNNKIHKVVNVCGRLRQGENVSPTIQEAARKSKSFKQSVLLFEKREPKLTKDQRKKILTVRAIFDEIVPTQTTILNGAKNIQLFSVEHMLTITLALTIYSKRIKNFLLI